MKKLRKFIIASLLLLSVFAFVDSQSTKPVLFKLKDIPDVSNTVATDGQILTWVSATGLATWADSTGGAPSSAHYLTDQAESGLSAEVVITANGKSLITAANYAAMRGLLDLESGTDFNAYDVDLTTYAGITPSANVQSLLACADYAAMKTALALVIGTNVQAQNSILTELTALTDPAADKFVFWNDTSNNFEFGDSGGAPTSAHYLTDQAEAGLSAEVVVTANGKSLVTAVDYAAMRGLLDLESGTDFNAYDADLSTYAGITPSANIQSLLGAATYAAAKTLLTVANVADTTNGTTIAGAGGDSVSITHDGTNATISTTDGEIILDSSEAAAVAQLGWSDDDTNYVNVKAQEMAADWDWVWPAAVAGGANYVLNSTDANGILQFSDPTSIIAASSTTVAGKVELAIASEVNTGTDATRAVSPDSLAGSIHGTKIYTLKPMAEDTVVTSGDGKIYFRIPEEFNGMDLVAVAACVYTADDAQNMDIDIYNVTQVADMLSAAMRIEVNETDTLTSAQPGTINGATDDVATGDKIRIDVTTFTGTVAKGLEITLSFRLP